MANRVQQDSGEERVTAKSRPMMSLYARAPSNLSSSASENPRKKSCGNQNPWSAKAEKEDRTGQPVVDSDPKTALAHYHEHFIERSFSARYSEWDDNKAWSSQEWKADKSMDDGTGQPVMTSWGKTSLPIKVFFHEKTQRWNRAILLTHMDEIRRTSTQRFDTLSILNHLIWKGFGHGARRGKSEE